MTLAIEPMITEGSYEVVWLDDDWTVMTEDGGWAALGDHRLDRERHAGL